MSTPTVIAHRGASAELRDNSREAFEAAIACGAEMIEFDVRHTRDGFDVAFHDSEAGGHDIGTLRRDEIARASGAEPLLLREVLDLAAGRIGLDVHLKEDGRVGAVLAEVRARFDAGSVLVTSFMDAVVEQTRRDWPAVQTGLLLDLNDPRGARPEEALARARACDAAGVAPDKRLVARDGVAWAAEAGLRVDVWTVNDDATLGRLLAEPGVTGIITDVPERAIRLRETAS